MTKKWEKELACATVCNRCNEPLRPSSKRILSIYDHQPICMDCKKTEEARTDYAEKSQHMIGSCLVDTEVHYGDPGGYCYFHFYPFTCK